jgi:hypothetical protein
MHVITLLQHAGLVEIARVPAAERQFRLPPGVCRRTCLIPSCDVINESVK